MVSEVVLANFMKVNRYDKYVISFVRKHFAVEAYRRSEKELY